MATRKPQSTKSPARTRLESISMGQKRLSKNPLSSSKRFGIEEFTSKRNLKPWIFGLLAIVVIAGLLYYFRSFFIVAIVNGQPVSRLTYMQELEREAGRQAMNTLVTKTLIEQEAKKQNVSISKKEIDDEIKRIEASLSTQGQKLDQVLGLQGINREGLEEQIRYQKLIEKMVGKDIKVTDKEITDYIEKNKDTFPQGTTESAMKTSVADQLKRQKLNDKIQTWLDSIQKKAQINRLI